jgi:hypothetical protein
MLYLRVKFTPPRASLMTAYTPETHNGKTTFYHISDAGKRRRGEGGACSALELDSLLGFRLPNAQTWHFKEFEILLINMFSRGEFYF